VTDPAPGPVEATHTSLRIVEEHGRPIAIRNTIGSRAELSEALAEIRDRGYAADDEERLQGVQRVAAPRRRGARRGRGPGPASPFSGDRFAESSPGLRAAANVVEVNVAHSG